MMLGKTFSVAVMSWLSSITWWGCGGSTQSNAQTVVPDSGWSQPQLVSNLEQVKIFRYPTIAITDRGFAVAGYGIKEFDATRYDGRSFKIIGDDGDVIPGPTGEWQFLNAVIAYTTNGSLHLIWGETPNEHRLRKGTDWPATQITELWQSSRDQSGIWTSPKQVISAQTIDWGLHRGTTQTAPFGRAVLSVVVTGMPYGRVVRALSLTDSGWRLLPGQHQDLNSVFPLASDAVFLGSEIHAVVQGPSTFTGGPPVIASIVRTEADSTWSSPNIIRGLEPATHVLDMRQTVLGDTSLTFVWVQEINGQHTIGVAKRTAQSNIWTLGPSLQLSFFPINLRAVYDTTGSLRVLFQPLGPPGKTYETEFLDSWSEPHEILRGYDAADLALTKTNNGVPLLLFSQTKGGKVETYFSHSKK